LEHGSGVDIHTSRAENIPTISSYVRVSMTHAVYSEHFNYALGNAVTHAGAEVLDGCADEEDAVFDGDNGVPVGLEHLAGQRY
jgi:hypothetical protein